MQIAPSPIAAATPVDPALSGSQPVAGFESVLSATHASAASGPPGKDSPPGINKAAQEAAKKEPTAHSQDPDLAQPAKKASDPTPATAATISAAVALLVAPPVVAAQVATPVAQQGAAPAVTGNVQPPQGPFLVDTPDGSPPKLIPIDGGLGPKLTTNVGPVGSESAAPNAAGAVSAKQITTPPAVNATDGISPQSGAKAAQPPLDAIVTSVQAAPPMPAKPTETVSNVKVAQQATAAVNSSPADAGPQPLAPAEKGGDPAPKEKGVEIKIDTSAAKVALADGPSDAKSGSRDPDQGGSGSNTAQAQQPVKLEASAPVAKSAPPIAVDRNQVVQQVADRIELLAASRTRDGVVVHLEPPGLGSMTVTIRKIESTVDASIVTSNDQVRDALAQSRPQLAAALQSKGLSLGQVDVSSRSSGNSAQFAPRQGSSQPGAQNQQSTQARAGSNSREAQSAPTRTATVLQAYRKIGGVDVWI